MRYPGFIGGSYESQALTADQEKTVNFYVERMESQGATTDAALYPTPGVESLGTLAGGGFGGRAHFFENGLEFAVVGGVFYQLYDPPAAAAINVVAVDSNPATISSNGDGGGQIFITSGGNGYIYNPTTAAFTQITALDGKATMGGMLDGYFIALDANTSTWYFSALLDGLTWTTGTDFAQRSKASDPWVSMKVLDQYIWLFGEKTSEVWYNAGGSFPFAAHPSGLIRYGIVAPFSVTVVDDSLVWLGATEDGSGFVLRATGFHPEVISTYPLQRMINGLAVVDDAIADSYNDLGHTFYLLTFPAENRTVAWDAQTRIWCDRGTWNTRTGEYDAWRPRWHAYAFGEHRILDAVDSTLYRMSTDLTTDAGGGPIRRLRRPPALMGENQRIYYPGFELDLEPGLGTATGQGADPQVMMRQSKDGGKTWGSERLASAGKIGEYSKRVRWNRCGEGRRMTFEVSTSDPIPWRITNAYLTPDPVVPRGPGAQRDRELQAR